MATRARIGIELEGGAIVASYHHWDGYPAGLGYNLLMNWMDRAKMFEAVALGDASTWGKEIGVKVDFDDRDAQQGQNVYYGRDRGESNVGPRRYTDMEDFAVRFDNAGEEYGYVLRLDGTLSMVNGYGKITEDAEDDIILDRARMIQAYRREEAA